MKKVITYGTFDLLHQGHLNLLRRAKALGDELIVGVTNDNFDRERGKLNVRNNVLERVEAVKATGLADKIIIEDYVGQKIDDIQRYGVDIFAIGSDWEGKFDYLKEYCQVVYLPRTEGISSTMLRNQDKDIFEIGIVGTGRIAARFVPEAAFVDSVKVTSVYNPNASEADNFGERFSLEAFSGDFGEFLKGLDAIYIASPHLTHYEYAKEALHRGKHVLCEIPLTLDRGQAEELYGYAKEHSLILLEASKTAFCPAFNHIVTLIKSGVIGDVVDVQASISKMVEPPCRELDREMAGGAVNEHASLTLLPAIKILGTDFTDLSFHSKVIDGVDVYTKVIVNYPFATASATLGIGVKTEGNLVISGTGGYVYVPAPWWLTSFFEIRYEDQRKNKKFFYSYEGDGLRYEIQEFVSMIMNGRTSSYKLSRKESCAIAGIIEKFNARQFYTELI